MTSSKLASQSWSRVVSNLLPHTLPPFFDEVEFSLFLFVLVSLFFIQTESTEGFTIPVLVALVIHFNRGIRWQLVLLYPILICLALQVELVFITRVGMLAAVIVTLVFCIAVPAIPSLASSLDSQGPFKVGVQDVAFSESLVGREFLIRCFYPCPVEHHSFSQFVVSSLVVAAVLCFGGVYALESEHVFRGYSLSGVFLLLYAAQLVLDFFHSEHQSDYVPEGNVVLRGVAKYASLPFILFSHMKNMKINCREDAPIAPSARKIVLFLPGLGGVRTSYSAICIQMASQGYFVVSLESSDGTPCVSVLPSGRVSSYIPFDKTSEVPDGEHTFRMNQLIQRTKELDAVMRFLLRQDQIDNVMVSFTSSKAGSWWGGGRRDSFSFSSALSQSRFWQSLRHHAFDDKPILVGHSFGGATVIHVSTSEHEGCKGFRAYWGIQSVVALDPWLFPLTASSKALPISSVDYPLLIMHADKFQWEANLVLEIALVCAMKKVLHLRVHNAGHFDYNEIGLLAPVLSAMMNKSGKQDPVVLQRSINAIVSAFLSSSCRAGVSGPLDLTPSLHMAQHSPCKFDVLQARW